MSLLTQRNSLPETNDNATADEAPYISPRRESLHERGYYNQSRPNGHANPSAAIIRKGTSEEETCYDSTDSVRCVDCTDSLGALFYISISNRKSVYALTGLLK